MFDSKAHTPPAMKHGQENRITLGRILMAIGISELLVLAMVVVFAIASTSAHAAELDTRADFVLAYADPGDRAIADPFGDVFMDEHELNDAWMGMEVRTIDGDIAGYISDAILDEDGTIATVFVSPGSAGQLRHEIALAPEYVILDDLYVTVDMTMNTLLSQKTSAEYIKKADLN